MADHGIESKESLPANSTPELEKLREEIQKRCKTANLACEELAPLEPGGSKLLRVGMRCGRGTRWVSVYQEKRVLDFSAIPFEAFTFLSDYEAICSYQEQMIEAAVRPLTSGFLPLDFTWRKVFGQPPGQEFDVASQKIVLTPPQEGFPRIEMSNASKIFQALMSSPSPLRRRQLTIKILGCKLNTHDQAIALLKKISGALFFQIDLLSGVPLSLIRERRRPFTGRTPKTGSLATELQYPQTEFDDAPLSLYWYGRSASGIPLLQFLAFYQVLEFYFPIYSQAEARRKVRMILKEPTFRSDRDADIGRLLSSLQMTRSGGYGDERAQLRATLSECIQPESLRNFFESETDRKEFYLGKSQYHKIPLANPNVDLRADVAERMYDIRCRIVHTKNDSREIEGGELLLPFSKEAEQLSIDIELARFLAEAALMNGSLPLQI